MSDFSEYFEGRDDCTETHKREINWRTPTCFAADGPLTAHSIRHVGTRASALSLLAAHMTFNDTGLQFRSSSLASTPGSADMLSIQPVATPRRAPAQERGLLRRSKRRTQYIAFCSHCHVHLYRYHQYRLPLSATVECTVSPQGTTASRTPAIASRGRGPRSWTPDTEIEIDRTEASPSCLTSCMKRAHRVVRARVTASLAEERFAPDSLARCSLASRHRLLMFMLPLAFCSSRLTEHSAREAHEPDRLITR